MPLDAVCLRAVVCELSDTVLEAKIDKIYQPARDEVVLLLRGKGKDGRLLLSANPAHPRAQLTALSFENPQTPPMFCMLLRKHLQNGRIRNLVQPPMERVLVFSIEAMDELGVFQEKHLVLEAMGRHSNLILTDGEGRIIDCLRRVDFDMSPQRQVLPGLFYHLPPAQDKQNPLTLTAEERAALLRSAPEEQKVVDALLNQFCGLSPLLCRELAFRAGGDVDLRLHEADRDRLCRVLNETMERVERAEFTPCLLQLGGKPKDYYCLPITQYGAYYDVQTAEGFSKLLDSFYAQREIRERMAAKSSDLRRSIASARERAVRKVAVQEKELSASLERDTWRVYGDLITSSLHQMKKGMQTLRTMNYYGEDCPEIAIPLDPLLTPQQNAARYYKRYQKAKTAAQVLKEQIAKGEQDIVYLDSVLEALSKAERESDLLEIRAELVESGYVKHRSRSRKEKKQTPKPLSFRSTGGYAILVGKNNVQNDQLTLKTAYKSDLWFHVQKRPGSHVILQCEGTEPDEQSVLEAARLAAYYSSAREADNVPVDYTQVRYVKKPSGARPGMVIYETYRTMLVTPDEQLTKTLKG